MAAFPFLLVAMVGCTGPHDDDGTPPAPPDGPPTLIASSSATVTVGSPDLAFAPDGTLWISWVELHEDRTADVFVVRSADDGRTFSAPVQADDVDQLFLGAVRQPVLAVDDERVALVVGGGSVAGENSILLFLASAAAPVFETEVMDEGVYFACDQAPADWISLVDQPEVQFDAAGQLWVNWKRGTPCESFELVQARERDGFAVVPLADGVRGQPCDCCPTDYLQTPGGDVLLAFRNNDANLREIYVGVAPGGGDFTGAYQVSSTGWVIGGCPLDGPSLTADGDTLVATWADASQGDNYQWMTVSSDGGQVWTPSFRVAPANDESVTWPQVTTAADGTIWSSVEEIRHQTNVVSTTDHGTTFTSHPADAPSGPLSFPEIAASPDGAVGVVGVTDEGELWYLGVSDAD